LIVRCNLIFGGAKGSRTPDLLHAMQALYQLSYGPKFSGGMQPHRVVKKADPAHTFHEHCLTEHEQ
jgi:hypothetical protein